MRLGVEAAIVEGRAASRRHRGRGRDGSSRSASRPKRGGGIAAPGFVDLQVNGYGGVDFAAADAAGYATAGEALLEGGVTAYQPTLITAPEDAADRRVAGGARWASRRARASSASTSRARSSRRAGSERIPRRRGAIPTAELLERLLAAGPVSHITLAPELPGALELVDLLHDARHRRLVRAHRRDRSRGRTRPSTAASARSRTSSTRCGRSAIATPGIAGAALVRDDVIVQVILDGHHLAAETAQLVWRAAAGRVALVTDAIAAAGTDATTARASAASTSRSATASRGAPTASSPAAS